MTVALAFYAVSRVGTYNIDNSVRNIADSSVSVQNISVTGNRYVKEVRKWSDLPRDEKIVIKAEALATFPKIKKIGTGVDWKPFTEWLIEEKGVVHSNPRDIFRDRATGEQKNTKSKSDSGA